MSRNIICVAPIKDETWVLKSFIENTLNWADFIVILDQSTNSACDEICQHYDRVYHYWNEDSEFDEGSRQKQLWRHARSLASDAIIFALDADECLISNEPWSEFRAQVRNLPPGTTINLEWPHLMRDRKTYLMYGMTPFGYVDDGRDDFQGRIHNPRVPVSANTVELNNVKNAHLVHLDLERQTLKQCWYQFYEISKGLLDPIQAFRRYNDYKVIEQREGERRTDLPVPQLSLIEWGVEPGHWWLSDIRRWLAENGARSYKYLDVWEALAELRSSGLINYELPAPSSISSKLLFAYLNRTQSSRYSLFVRSIDKLLQLMVPKPF